jgi:hypothetical protein
VRALQNRRFRLVLLVLLGVPLAGFHLGTTLVAAAVEPGFRADDFLVYMHAARDLAAGADPYASFLRSPIHDPTLNQGYIYPPLLAWLLQPLVPLGDHAATVVAEIVEHACLVGFVLLLRPILALASWEATAWIYVLVTAWFPVRQNLYGAQINVVLLFLLTVWLALGRRAIAGIPLALTFAIKFITAPLLAYVGLRRWWAALVAAAATLALAWGISAPGWMPEYWRQVFPQLSAGTGFRENIAPAGTLMRILQPASYYGQNIAPAAPVRALSLGLSLALLALTAWWLWRPAELTRRRLALEGAAVVAVAPLVATLTWPSHAALLLLPIAILLVEGGRRRDWTLTLLVACGTLLLGPVRSGELALIAAGVQSELVLRPLAETGVLGLGLVYVATLLATRPPRGTLAPNRIMSPRFGSRN